MAWHILIVEDDVVNRRYLGELLLAQGHQCCLSGSLREARQALQAHDFDLCLVDQQLPDGQGESLRELASCRLIMMSGDPPAQAAGWLCKPIAAETLAQLLGGAPSAAPVAELNAGLAPDLGVVADLDDTAAMRSLGAGGPVLAGLRRLLRTELTREAPLLRQDLADARHTAVTARLHRWKAAAALCGAERLSRSCLALEQALRNGTDASDAGDELNDAVGRLLRLLDEQG
jgi:CheY-like chemotaxis protein